MWLSWNGAESWHECGMRKFWAWCCIWSMLWNPGCYDPARYSSSFSSEYWKGFEGIHVWSGTVIGLCYHFAKSSIVCRFSHFFFIFANLHIQCLDRICLSKFGLRLRFLESQILPWSTNCIWNTFLFKIFPKIYNTCIVIFNNIVKRTKQRSKFLLLFFLVNKLLMTTNLLRINILRFKSWG